MNKTHSIETKNGVGPDATNDGSPNVIYHISADDIKALEADGSLIQIDIRDCTKAREWTDELRDLAPVDDIKDFSTYEKMLNWVFQNKRIKNVALSGPYGSGKSSIIETYLRRHEEVEKYALRVSMATFTCEAKVQKDGEEQSKKLNQGDRNEFSEDEIEKAILKQLFYKVNPKRIPHSTYRRMSVRSRITTYIVAFFTLFISAVGTGIVFPNIGVNFFGLLDLFFGNNYFKSSIFRVVELTLVIALIALFIEVAYGSELFKMHLKELKILSGAKIKRKTGASGSVFNRNLDEILYFFEITGYRTVFFEDIDRLENAKIFIHLHELCYLLNNDDVIKNKPIKFVYAIKEDFFEAESKTKFFDFIIPVIPIVNATNSCEKLIENIRMARGKGIEHDISNEFARGIGLYISDMRMLLNVYNEFLAYKQALKVKKEHGLSDEKMFAMMAFKSMCPRDFAEIQAEKGVVKQAFIDKDQFVSKKNKEIDSKIQEERLEKSFRIRGFLNERKRGIESKYRKQVYAYYNDIRTNLLHKKLKKLISEFGEESVLSEEVRKNEFLMFLLKNGYIEEGYTDYINYFYAETIGGEFVGETERVFILHVKQQKPLDYSYEIKNPSAVIEHFGADSFGKHVMCNFDILRELVENKRNNGNNVDKLRKMIRMISENPEEYWEFIERFRRSVSKEISEKFVRILVHEWEGMWEDICENTRIIFMDIRESNNENYSPKRLMSAERTSSESKVITPLFGSRLYFFRQIILGGDLHVLLDGRSGRLKQYLECDSRILQKLEIGKEGNGGELSSFDKAMLILGVEFKELNFDGISDDVAHRIIMGGYYSVNVKTLPTVMRHISNGMVSKDDLESRPYSTIIALRNKSLEADGSISKTKKKEIEVFLDHIQSIMDEFVRDYVLRQKKLRDNVDDILDMIQRLREEPKLQKKLIQKEGFILEDITYLSRVKTSGYFKKQENARYIWDLLLESDKVKVGWENVFAYYHAFGSTDTVKDYVVRHSDELRKDMLGKNINQSIFELLHSGTYAFEATVD